MSRFGSHIELKTAEQIRTMRRAGLLTQKALQAAASAVRPGVTTQELDEIASQTIADGGGTSNFLGFEGYPATICVSINDVIVHGIPGSQVIEEGDVVSLDCGAIIDGWHGDSAMTVGAGVLSPEDAAMIEACRAGMWAGIAAIATGGRVGDIGEAVEDEVTRHGEYGIIEDYVGHGIGSSMHMPPNVFNYAVREAGPRLREGMCLCVEPMITQAGIDTSVMADDWGVRTADHSRAAHWEHTVAIVPGGGIWVLTAEDGGVQGLEPFGLVPSALS